MKQITSKQLAELKRKNGWTIANLALILDVSERTVCRWLADPSVRIAVPAEWGQQWQAIADTYGAKTEEGER